MNIFTRTLFFWFFVIANIIASRAADVGAPQLDDITIERRDGSLVSISTLVNTARKAIGDKYRTQIETVRPSIVFSGGRNRFLRLFFASGLGQASYTVVFDASGNVKEVARSVAVDDYKARTQ